MKKLMLLCVVTTGLSGCATVDGTPASQMPNRACGVFRIINPSQLDTAETKRQVLAHNRVYRSQCEEAK